MWVADTWQWRVETALRCAGDGGKTVATFCNCRPQDEVLPFREQGAKMLDMMRSVIK